MVVTKKQADHLCSEVVNSLAGWSALSAVMQSGGLEEKATGLISNALENLTNVINAADGTNLIVMREYRRDRSKIDFAMIIPSIGQPLLNVDTIIEVKSNYAWQCGLISGRTRNGVNQANCYRKIIGEAKDAYVLYFVAAPYIDITIGNNIMAMPGPQRDTGWGYWNRPLQLAINAIIGGAAAAGANILGEASAYARILGVPPTGVDPNLYCALIKCP